MSNLNLSLTLSDVKLVSWFRLTVHAAKTLYDSSIAFGARQGGQAVQQNGDLHQ